MADELAVGLSLGVALPNIVSVSWMSVCQAQSKAILPLVTELGAGEREALALARRYARVLGVQFTGTLGVLEGAKQEGYLSEISPILARLDNLNFRLAVSTRTSVLKLAGELP